jgi:hydroxyethylthiazole kinase
MGATSAITASDCAAALEALQDRPPLVQSLTNIVVAQWTANVLLAVGAAPAMVDNPHEAAAFARIAGGVLVNLGTPYDDTVVAMEQAVSAATDQGTPWVLDPVAVGALEWRTKLALDLLAIGRPAVIRGNASEVLALTGGAGGKGVDSAHTTESAADAARALAAEHRTVVAVSGPVDHLTDGDRLVRVHNGHEWLTRVTGVGCALGALVAAFAAVVPDPLLGATAATATLTVAAESAAEASHGPGSFAVALLDELAGMTPARLAAATRVS